MSDLTDVEHSALLMLQSVDPTHPRVVVRWVDETRILPHGDSGFTVGPVSHIILTAIMEGAPTQRRFDDLSLDRLRWIARLLPLELICRTDNLT